jgi:bifunctional non-homologous end joining protein LigD
VSVPGYRSSAPAQTPAEQPTAFVAFDLLRDGDVDWRPRPLRERRKALEARCRDMGSPLLRISRQVVGHGHALYAEAEREGWEGLLVKGLESAYRSGKRSPEWRKFKILQQDEFVIAGWTDPRGTRNHFGALILGARGEDGTLDYVGDVGTGFTGAELDRVAALLAPLATRTCPFDPPPAVQGAPNLLASRTAVQACTGWGARHRFSPVGGAANGMPRNERTEGVSVDVPDT